MGKNKLLAGLGAGVLVSSVLAAAMSSSSAASGGGSDAVFEDTNPGPFTIIDTAAINATNSITNAAGVVTDVNLRLNDLGHTYPDDIDMELVAPDGRAVPLMSDMCFSHDVEDVDITFDDEAATALPDTPAAACTSGSYKPGNAVGGADNWPVAPTGTTLSHFDGMNPNGTWSLRVVDDLGGDSGDLEGGFTIRIETAPFSVLIPATGSVGAASPYPLPIVVSGQLGKVTDVNMVMSQVAHQNPDDVQVLLVAPNGAKALLLNDACGSADMTNVSLTFDDEAAAGPADAGPCVSGAYKPAIYDVVTTFPGAAPAGPYTAPLSAFDGIDPNGTWLLYINDDNSGGGYGFLGAAPTLSFSLSDVTAPDTKLVGKKPENTTKTRAKIRFISTEPGSTFQCKVDGKRFKPCTSPLKLKNLKVGKHKVLIVATDAAGNKDPKALKVKWRIFPKLN